MNDSKLKGNKVHIKKRSKPIKKSESVVEEQVRIAVQKQIDDFIQQPNAEKLEFPASLTKQQRAYVHQYVTKNYKNLKSKSFGTVNRFLVLYKSEKSTIIKDDATFTLGDQSKHMIFKLLKNCPLTHREKCDLEPNSSKHLSNKIAPFKISVGNMTNGKVSVPPIRQNPDFVGVRQSLPIFPYRQEILHMIESNQVIVLSGQTGSGKTTQVPQYLLEEFALTKKNCRIICTQPRRLSAISVAERVSHERNETVGQTIGYQIRLESRISPTSNLIFCTNGVLLRCLMSGNPEEVFNGITHIIVDEVHERDKYSDFLLISIKQNLHLNPNAKIILMSATIDANVFTKYFNDAPYIEIPGRLHEVEILPLEMVLFEIGYSNGTIEAAKKKLKQEEESKLQNMEQPNGKASQKSNKPQVQAHLDDETRQLLDEVFKTWWLSDDEEAFNQFTYMVASENVPIDFRHSDTDMTALMIVAGKGNTEEVKILLDMGADVFIECRNEYTAYDLALQMKHVECAQLLDYAMKLAQERKLVTQQGDPVQNDLSDKLSKILLEEYQTTTNEDEIDHSLLFDVIQHIHQNKAMGGILVFLPGYDDIIEQNDRVTKNLRNPNGASYKIFMLHSNMQTKDQKSVFQSFGPNCRKIILSTNIAETSVTIDDVVFVIDTGKVKQMSFDALSGTSCLQATWISQACGKQRTGRAGRTRPGICLRLYSLARYENMSMYTVPEILRVPLTEICLQTKLIARNVSITEFLSRSIQPPSPISIKQSIKLLQTIGALDELENLTELGVHLADLPVDCRLGKTLIYSVLLKCLDPVLTIVSALSVNDPFVLPAFGRDKDTVVQIKKQLAENSMSDHLTLLRIFQKWNDSKNSNCDRQFCKDNFVSSGTMETICGIRSQILGHLRSVGLVKSQGAGNIHELNKFSNNWAVVKACITGGLYPNICRIDRKTATLKAKHDNKIIPHSSSIFRDRDIKKSKEIIQSIPSDWMLYEEKQRFGRLNLIKCNTAITAVTVALFAGPIMQSEEEHLRLLKEDNDDDEDSDCEIDGPGLDHKYILDDWIYFALDTETAYMMFHLRQKLNALLVKILHNPKLYFQSEKDSDVIQTVAQLLEEEERRHQLPMPANIGMRPKTVMLGFSPDLNYGTQEMEQQTRNVNELINRSLSRHQYRNPRTNNNPRQSQDGRQNMQPNTFHVELNRYFMVNAASEADIHQSLYDGKWRFSTATYNYLYQVAMENSSMNIVIIFQVACSSRFCGTAKFVVINRNVTLMKLSDRAVTFLEVRKYLERTLTNPRYLDKYYDGEELPNDVAVLLKPLLF